MTDKTPGQVAYEACREYTHLVRTPWHDMSRSDRAAWEAVAAAARKPLEDKLAAARIKLREIVCTEEPDDDEFVLLS